RETPGIRRRDGHQHGDDADPRLGAAGPAGHRLGPHHVGFDDGDRGAGSGWCAAAAGLPRCHRHAGVPDLCRCGAGTGTPPRGRGGLRQPQAPPLSARGGVDRACRCQRPALAAVQFGLRPDRGVVVEVQRGTSSGRGAGARGPVQCCWRDPGPCNAPGYPRLVQPQWTVRNSCVNRANRDCSIATGADSKIARQEQGESTWDPLNASELAPNSANGLIPSVIAWAKSQPPGNVAIVTLNLNTVRQVITTVS